MCTIFQCATHLPLAPSLGLRVNGMYEDGESFRRHVELERYGVSPTLGLLAGPNTRIDLGYEYFHDRRTTDRGVPAFNTNRAETLASHDRFERIAANTSAKVIIQHEPADVAKLPAFPNAAR